MQLAPKAPRRGRGSRIPRGGSSVRDMLGTRAGTLSLALACAVAAAAAIVLALNSYKQSVSTANEQDTVLVANGLIQKGTSGAAIAAGRLYSTSHISAAHASAGAISDAAVLRGKVAVSDILPGQQLTAAAFAPASGVANELAADQRAVEVQLDASHGIGGVLQAGDHVDVYAGFNLVSLMGGSSSGPAKPIIRLLNSNVPVLQAGGAGASGTVVLAVNDNMAPEISYAADNGKLWLVLRPGNGQNPSQPNTTIETILNGIPPIADHSETGRLAR